MSPTGMDGQQFTLRVTTYHTLSLKTLTVDYTAAEGNLSIVQLLLDHGEASQPTPCTLTVQSLKVPIHWLKLTLPNNKIHLERYTR